MYLSTIMALPFVLGRCQRSENRAVLCSMLSFACAVQTSAMQICAQPLVAALYECS